MEQDPATPANVQETFTAEAAQQKQQKKPEIQENEVRIQSEGTNYSYVTYGINLFTVKNFKQVQLKAMGRAIHKAVIAAEVIKRRIKGLYQTTHIASVSMEMRDGQAQKGDGIKTAQRQVSVITIVLSLDAMDEEAPGYQPPIPEDQVQPQRPYYPRRGYGRGYDGRGRGRGQYNQMNRGMRYYENPHEQYHPAGPNPYARGVVYGGRGRGPRGRFVGGRGRGRGGRGRFRGQNIHPQQQHFTQPDYQPAEVNGPVETTA